MIYDQAEPCDNCQHPRAKTGVFHSHGENSEGPLHRVRRNFCEVCSSTFLSSATNYPRQCPDVRLWQSVGWIANEILLAIKDASATAQAPQTATEGPQAHAGGNGAAQKERT